LPAGYSYPTSDTAGSAANWRAVNYILNNKVGSYWDVQIALWNFIGGPVPSGIPAGTGLVGMVPNPAGNWVKEGYPAATPANVSAMVKAALNNAVLVPNWQPPSGGVIAVVLVVPAAYIASSGATPTATQLTIMEVPVPKTQTVCCPPPTQPCPGGSVWCNAHLTCNPGRPCNIYCRNSSVTFSCKSGKTYTYPVPDGQVCFSEASPSCVTPNCSFTGGKWCTTVPSSGDSQCFLSGCGIPWQSDFANCTSVCWTGSFSCDTRGVTCSWEGGAACYSANMNNCGSVQVKPCYQNYCGYASDDCAGTPENYKSYCQGGNYQGGNYRGGNNQGNYCGSWSSSSSFTCNP
jgi:hypothetical protein